MVPSFSQLICARSSSDQTSYTTASISPTADRLLLAAVFSMVGSGTAAAPTLSGGGVSTWTLVTSYANSGGTRLVSVFRALTGGSPTSGAITIDFAGVTQSNCDWQVTEVADCLLTGTNGADAIAQSKVSRTSSNVASFTLTFDTAWDADDNRGWVGFGVTAQRTLTEVSPFTLLGSVSGGVENSSLGVVTGRDGSSLGISCEFTGTNAGWIAVGVEVVGEVDATPPEVTFDYPVVATLRLNGGLN